MTTSEQTYSLLSNTPIRVADSDPVIYYWRGLALTEPLLLTMIGSMVFRIPVSPEMRSIAGRSQRHAILNRFVEDAILIDEAHYRGQDVDQVYYHMYASALRNQLQETNMFQGLSVETVLNWVRPREIV